MTGSSTTSLPAHDEVSPFVRVVELASLAAALVLVAAGLVRVHGAALLFHWWAPAVVLAAALAADLVSGLVHWTADTWFSETMPVLGRRFLRPFRVHHANPDDFLRRDFVDCNGDVAMLNLPILGAALAMPIDSELHGAAVVALISFALVSLPTNQVHQWAHMPTPPPVVQWLQARGLILSGTAHAQHHRAPYVANYCIATGWCNRPLAAAGFFPACERLIERLFGLRPRGDEEIFGARW